MVPNSSARLLTMPLTWLASSGVSRPCCDAGEEIAEHVGTILSRLQRPQRKMDRCSSAGRNSPVDQEASSVDVAVLGRSVKESVEQRIDVLDDLSIEAVPGLLGQSNGVGLRARLEIHGWVFLRRVEISAHGDEDHGL